MPNRRHIQPQTKVRKVLGTSVKDSINQQSIHVPRHRPLVDLNAILAEKRAQDQQEITPWQKQPHKKQQQSAAATPAANTTTTTPAAAIVAGPSHTPGHTVQLNVVPQLLCRTLPDAPPDALPSTVDAIRPPASLVPTFPDSMTIDQVACTVLQSGWIMAQACRWVHGWFGM